MTAHTRSRTSNRHASQQNTETTEEKPSKRIKTERRSTASSVSSTTSIASTTNSGRNHRNHHGQFASANETNDENNVNSANSGKGNNKKSASSTKNIIDSDSLTYLTDERVLCYHGVLIYEAKILKGEIWENKSIPEENGPHYFVHYKGWKQTWDEWVPEERILKFTQENLELKNSLKEAYSPHTRNHEKKSSSTNDSSKKKNRENTKVSVAEPIRKVEIKIPIPDPLKLQLVDDWENITKDKKLVPLPRKPTVVEILSEYKKVNAELKKDEKNSRETDLISEMLDGIQLYFDRALGNILLYHFERQQYIDIENENEEKKMSEIYGAEHLLRLFVQFPFLLEETNLDQDSLTIIQQYMVDFLKFLADNQKKFFTTEYEPAKQSYITKFEAETTKPKAK